MKLFWLGKVEFQDRYFIQLKIEYNLFTDPFLLASLQKLYFINSLINFSKIQYFELQNMNPRQKLQVSSDENKYGNMDAALGVDGKFQWPIRIFTPLLFVTTLLVNYLLGTNSNRQVSDKFYLYVTPPGFFFIIWAVIYTGLVIANIYNLIKNVWNLKAHIFFGVSNILNIVWTFVFGAGTLVSVVFASVILITLSVFILLTWIQIGNIPKDQINAWTYIVRNIFAFYLGWCIAASNLNLGMVIVNWWGAAKQTQMIIFWVMAPLCAVGAFTFNTIKYGKYGALSCFCLWFSVIWAFVGAGMTSYKCVNGIQQNC